MALCLQRSFVSIRGPSSYLSSSSDLRRTAARVSVRRLDSVQSSPATWHREIRVDRGFSRVVPFATSNEDLKSSDKNDESDNIKIENNSQEAWQESLNYFKSEALKLKSKSEESYEIYSKKAQIALLELSEKLKIQADKAQKDLGQILNEIGEESKEVLTRVYENPPDSTKELVLVFKESSEVKNLDDVRDYHIGVVYGSFLAIGGFLSFMATGNTAGIRFGIILGIALISLGILSRRNFKIGNPSPLSFKAQTAIATWIFLRELIVFTQGGSFINLLKVLVSGGITAFYVYIMMTRGSQKSQPSSDN